MPLQCVNAKLTFSCTPEDASCCMKNALLPKGVITVFLAHASDRHSYSMCQKLRINSNRLVLRPAAIARVILEDFLNGCLDDAHGQHATVGVPGSIPQPRQGHTHQPTAMAAKTGLRPAPDATITGLEIAARSHGCTRTTDLQNPAAAVVVWPHKG